MQQNVILPFICSATQQKGQLGGQVFTNKGGTSWNVQNGGKAVRCETILLQH